METSACNLCEYKSTRLSDLRKHISIHNKVRKYACGICETKFTASSDLRRHERTHQDKKGFICSFENCGFATSRREHLHNHESTHASIESRLNHPCHQCDKYFSSRSVLNRHVKTCGQRRQNVPKEERCKCAVCGKIFSSIFKMKQHVKLHNENFDHSCDICSKEFATKEALRKHSALHDEKKFSCRICGRKFGRKDYLEKHLQVHDESGSIEYVCTGCNASYSSTQELQKHCMSCSNACQRGGGEEDLVFIPNYSHEVVIAQVEADQTEEEEPSGVDQDQVYYIII